ncbi:hypothetical protein LCGC14_0662820 [marine sediment metagenome]|uniref:Phage gp6-like head-tail connector protein n=1 Tax=marine sediment metagenome TaxID=412755 RepID=A0A0F9RD70_9ZZZZ
MADMIDVDDVNRYLTSDATAEVLAPYIAAAIEAIQNLTGRSWSDSVVERDEVFYNVREGAILWLDDITPAAVASVSVYAKRTDRAVSLLAVPNWSTSSDVALTEDIQYQVMDRGRIHLFATGIMPATWARVTVTYTPSGSVPQTVQEAAAVLAASMYAQAARSSSGLKSERLGDYGYTKNEAVEGGDLLPAVRRRLTPYNRKRRARTT